MSEPAYERPDYEPAPDPVRARGGVITLGIIQGEPYEPIIVRRGWRGWLVDRPEQYHRWAHPASNECGQCGQPTPGYSWCSRECLDAHSRDEPAI